MSEANAFKLADSLSLNPTVAPSSSATGRSDSGFGYLTSGTPITFGDHVTGGASSSSSSVFGPLVRDLVTGVIVALLARYLWSMID